MKRVFLAALASCAAAVLGAQEPTQPQTITLTLDQAIEIALNENPTIRIADMDIELLFFFLLVTVFFLLPSLSVSAQFRYSFIKLMLS